jgi:hypothetical protein
MKKLGITIYLAFAGIYSLLAQNNGTVTVVGQDSTQHVITTAVPFLTITPDTRAAGMGDAGVATSADANSAYWNPGKLAFIDKAYGGSLSYTPWLAKIINDMKLLYLSGFYKISREQSVAMSLKYFDMGDINFRDGNNVDQGRYNPREYAVDVTYSRMLTEHFGMGVTLRYIRSNLTGALPQNNFDAQAGESVAADIGAYYNKQFTNRNASLSLGATINNIGSKMTYTSAANKDFIPTNLRIGGAYKTELDNLNSLTFVLDFNKLMVPSPGINNRSKSLLEGIFGSFSDARGGFSEEISEVTISSGMEYWYNKTFAGRVGYFHEAADKGNRKYFTAGVGFRKDDYGIDVAYMIPTNKSNYALSETIRFTFMLTLPVKEVKQNESVTDNGGSR